ncbi:hypothetical protein ABZ990_24125 [Streptomyces sp. NPDC046203]|uniref:hypothetical protein n=1 Tax=Streptomyces sp. NPDC046203 TaxID=3154602 RepID=UPI0033C8F6F5
MIWWCKGRRLLSVVLPGLAAFALLAALAHDEAVSLPGLLGSGNLVFLVHLTPLLVTGVLTHSLAQRLPEAEDLAMRPVRRYDVLLVLLTAVAAAGAAGVVGAVAHSSTAYEAGRNTLFLTGLMLLAGAVYPRAASVAPVAWVFTAALVGYQDHHRPWPWAVTLHRAGYLPTLALCVAVFLGGLVVLYRTRGHRPPTD